MSLSDPIADMLVRIRNAHMAQRDVVEIPHSRIKCEIAKLMKREGFVADYVVERGAKKLLRVYLKYGTDREPVIHGALRNSKPGLRKYVAKNKIPKVLGGMGIAILSTSSGIMTDKEARERHIGGEVLCSIW